MTEQKDKSQRETYSHVHGTDRNCIRVGMEGKVGYNSLQAGSASQRLHLVLPPGSLVSGPIRALGEEPGKNIVDNDQLHIRDWTWGAGPDDVLSEFSQRSKLERPIQLASGTFYRDLVNRARCQSKSRTLSDS